MFEGGGVRNDDGSSPSASPDDGLSQVVRQLDKMLKDCFKRGKESLQKWFLVIFIRIEFVF